MLKLVARLAIVVVLIVGAACGWLALDYRNFVDSPLNHHDTDFPLTVPSGASVRSVARSLSDQGLLEEPHYLVWLARWEDVAHKIRAGEYMIKAGSNPRELLEHLTSGRTIQYSLTIVEGWDVRQLLQAVRNDPVLNQTMGDVALEALLERLGFENDHPEGLFFPDTYSFPRGTTDVEFLRRAYETMQRHLDAEWNQRAADLPLSTPYEALILASIVEKETAKLDELAAVAGVFVRRLQRNMKLQTDPTVIYGLGESFDGNIRRRDLGRDTPYNTYVHHGLPPTPIALPGLGAIRAALHPQRASSLYFVARGDGSHQFSATLADHNKAVRKYQLQRNAPRSIEAARN